MGTPETPDAGQPDGGEPPDAGQSTDAGTPDAGRGPPYPIVLSHGFFGFDTFAGLDFFTYYFEVKDSLATEGELLVFTPTVDPFTDSATRASVRAQWPSAVTGRAHACVHQRRSVRGLIPSTSAACNQLILPAMGCRITSRTFMARSQASGA